MTAEEFNKLAEKQFRNVSGVTQSLKRRSVRAILHHVRWKLSVAGVMR